MRVSFGVFRGYPAVQAEGQLGLRNAAVLRDGLVKAAAEQPAGLVCDLRLLTASSEALTVLHVVADQLGTWPATPLAILVADHAANDRLDGLGISSRMPVSVDPGEVVPSLRRTPRLLLARLELPAAADAPAAARNFVECTLSRWRAPRRLDPARLMASELVTYALTRCGEDVVLRLSLAGSRVGIAVADRGLRLGEISAELSRNRDAAWELALVAQIADQWGVLPRRDTGNVVWAVLTTGGFDSPAVPTQTSRRPGAPGRPGAGERP